jgi:HEAT repeat protein
LWYHANKEDEMNKKDETETYVTRGNTVSIETISSLIAELGSKDGIVRVRARKSLVSIGHAAIGPLVEALGSKREWLRWEAAKTLAQIGDPSATQVLIGALQDKMFDVRWLAAEGLIRIGNKAIKPLLESVVKQPDSLWIREGAHHVLRDLPENNLKKFLKPVMHALEDVEPSLEVAIAAEAALNEIDKY